MKIWSNFHKILSNKVPKLKSTKYSILFSYLKLINILFFQCAQKNIDNIIQSNYRLWEYISKMGFEFILVKWTKFQTCVNFTCYILINGYWRGSSLKEDNPAFDHGSSYYIVWCNIHLDMWKFNMCTQQILQFTVSLKHTMLNSARWVDWIVKETTKVKKKLLEL